MKKKRIYFLGGLVLTTAIMLLFITRNSSKEIPRQEVNLRAATQDVSLEDMIKTVNNRDRPSNDALPAGINSDQYPRYTSQTDNPEAISRIQNLIRQNDETLSSGLQDIENERQGIYTHVDDRDAYSTVSHTVSPSAVRPISQVVESKPAEDAEVEVPITEPEPKKRTPFNSVSLSARDNKNAIKAYVHSEQTVMVGSTLKMRLGEDAHTDDGILVKKNSPIFGTVTSVDGERVNVKITHINHAGNILPFQKEVYSKDALLGIYVPGNPKSEATKDAAGGAIDGLPTSGIPGLDAATQIAGVVASSAAQAGKQAISKNVKKIKVTIKTNYEIFLRPDEKKK